MFRSNSVAEESEGMEQAGEFGQQDMSLGALLQRSLLRWNQRQHDQDLAKMALFDAAMYTYLTHQYSVWTLTTYI